MPKISGLQSIPETDELLRLLRKLLTAQKTQTDRKCVESLIKKLQQVGRSAAVGYFLWPLPQTASCRTLCSCSTDIFGCSGDYQEGNVVIQSD